MNHSTAESEASFEHEHLSKGVWVERRSFFGLTAAALWAANGKHSREVLSSPSQDAHLDYEEFLAEVVPIAKALVLDDSRAGEDRYLWTLASFAVRLSAVPVPQMRPLGKEGSGTYIGSNPGGDPFTVLHWRMDPHSEIGVHAHAYGNVVTLGLEGEARIRNYEMLGERDFEIKEAFRVRKTMEQILRPGDINLVPLAHGYCHGFHAGGAGARGLDITTRIRPKRAVPLLEIASTPVDADAAHYEAHWRFE